MGFMVVAGVFFYFLIHERSVTNKFYVELIHQNHQILRFSGRDWSFCSIIECTREQCPKNLYVEVPTGFTVIG